MEHGYSILVHYDPVSHAWLVSVPDLPGVYTEGESPEAAHENAREAIQAHIESMRKHGLAAPAPSAYEVVVV